MKHLINIILSIIIICCTAIACVGSYESHTKTVEVPHDAPMFEEEIIILHPDPTELDVTSKVPLIRTTQYVNLTWEEIDLLEQIAMAEAENQDVTGKLLVMWTVVNRSRRDGKSIEEVIYAPNQYYTAGMKPGDEGCHEAVALLNDGYDPSEGAIYFTSVGYSRYGEPLFRHGDHWFSR